jgi:hypothetical protein
MRLGKLQPIKRYQGPQWLVEPAGEWLSAEDSAEQEGAAVDVTVMDTNIAGWDTGAIIRFTDAGGAEYDYLAEMPDL